MSAYQLVIFDWDGTLMDSTGHIVSCMQQAITRLELPPLSDAQVSHIIGLGLNEAVQTLYPGTSAADTQKLANTYREIWLGNPVESPLFPNARELVSQLAEQDVLLGVATGKARRGLDKVFASTGLGKFFVSSRCADECHSKPHPQMVEELMTYCGASPSDTLMVGDTEFDLLMGHNAGAESLAVTSGAHPRHRLEACTPKGIVDDLHQVEDWLKRACGEI